MSRITVLQIVNPLKILNILELWWTIIVCGIAIYLTKTLGICSTAKQTIKQWYRIIAWASERILNLTSVYLRNKLV